MASPPLSSKPHTQTALDAASKLRAIVKERNRLRTETQVLAKERDEYKRQLDELLEILSDESASIPSSPIAPSVHIENETPKAMRFEDEDTHHNAPITESVLSPPVGRYLDVLSVMGADPHGWWMSTRIAQLLRTWPDRLRTSYRVANYLKMGRDNGDMARKVEGGTHWHRLTDQGRTRASDPDTPFRVQSSPSKPSSKPSSKKKTKKASSTTKIQKGRDIPTTEALALEHLAAALESASIEDERWLLLAELAESTGRKSKTLSGVLRRLEKAGEIEARRHPASINRHKQYAVPLPVGVSLLDDLDDIDPDPDPPTTSFTCTPSTPLPARPLSIEDTAAYWLATGVETAKALQYKLDLGEPETHKALVSLGRSKDAFQSGGVWSLRPSMRPEELPSLSSRAMKTLGMLGGHAQPAHLAETMCCGVDDVIRACGRLARFGLVEISKRGRVSAMRGA